MPTAYVKPYVKRQKNYVTDAEANMLGVTPGPAHAVCADQDT
jgi:hypothetical protein